MPAPEDSAYICSLSTTSVKKARDELFENAEDRLEAVQSFREWIKEQPHINCPEPETIYLLTFLRWAKWSQIRARERLEEWLKLRTSTPRMVKDLDPFEKNVMDILKAGYCIISPVKAENGESVCFLRLEVLDKFKWDMPTFIRASCIAFFCNSFFDEEQQVNGTIFFVDYYGFSAKSMKKMMSVEAQKTFRSLMGKFPGRWKKVVWYRAGVIMEACLAFFKPIMPKKLYERVSCHDNMETVYPIIPKKCLPEEYLPDDYKGPTSGTVQSLIDHTFSRVSEPKTLTKIKHMTGSAFALDESKKVQAPPTAHFRKLNVS